MQHYNNSKGYQRSTEVWFQNRRSKERRMRQLRCGSFRPTRRNRGTNRDDLCPPNADIFAHEAASDGFYGQAPLRYFCDGYQRPDSSGSSSIAPHPAFIMPPDAHRIPVDTPISETSYIEDSLRPPHSSPNMPLAAQDEAYRPLHNIYASPELKTVVPGW
ncbi:unnamed protein product [Enterobius vermicularis]|uniref:Homeobox domain-containing protein n=1 Tax=Enterobius vermicularis TaxID=51028 RepID=A0A0N4V730_ENTVE|nr:unnamed protein product [Enterobius vermicularis]